MKKNNLFLTIIFISIFGLFMYNIDAIATKLSKVFKSSPTVVISKPNNYYKSASYDYVKESADFIPYSKQDLRNIFYSILNNGYETFTFYCPTEYTDCLNDVNALSKDTGSLTHINNYVSPFNNFSSIKVIYSTNGEVNVEVTKLYSKEDIDLINNKIDSIMASIITNEMKLEDKILAIHDYIINNSKYDEQRVSGKSTYKSNIAYGPLIEGYAVCGGYADAEALFLNRLNVSNFKVASETHVWNAIYLNNKWLHLDLTWDDPISLNSNSDTLLHKFYLIDTKTLEDYHISDHEYDKTIYVELT